MTVKFEKEIPVFVKGEPGFAAKLNQLGMALQETRAAMIALGEQLEAAKPKTTTARAKAAAKAE